MPISANDFNELGRRAEKIVRELNLSLRSALISGTAPEAAARPHEQAYAKLKKDGDQLVKLNPQARKYVDTLIKQTRDSMNHSLTMAKRARGHRAETKGWQGKYNKAVGDALADAPREARKGVNRGIDSLVKSLVNDAITHPEIPANVKGQIARSLSGWLKEQDQVEDAVFVVEAAVADVAYYLHQKMTFTTEIAITRDGISKLKEISPEQSQQADAHAGALAKRSSELDALIGRRINQSTLRVKGYFRFKPHLVLDPAQRFVKDFELRSGIKLSKNDVKVELGTKIKLTNPLLMDSSSKTTVNPFMKVDIGDNFDLNAEYNATYKKGGFEDGQFKLSLSWRF